MQKVVFSLNKQQGIWPVFRRGGGKGKRMKIEDEEAFGLKFLCCGRNDG